MEKVSQRQVDANITRQKLVETALALFAKNGYSGTSIDLIALEAKVTKGAIYHHFKNKKEILIACYRLQAQWVQQAVNDTRASDDPWQQAFYEFEAFFEFVIDKRKQTLPLQEVITVLGWQTWRELDTEYTMGNIIRSVEKLKAKNEMKSFQTNIIADMIYGQLVNASMILITSENNSIALKELRKIMKGFLFSLRMEANVS